MPANSKKRPRHRPLPRECPRAGLACMRSASHRRPGHARSSSFAIQPNQANKSFASLDIGLSITQSGKSAKGPLSDLLICVTATPNVRRGYGCPRRGSLHPPEPARKPAISRPRARVLRWYCAHRAPPVSTPGGWIGLLSLRRSTVEAGIRPLSYATLPLVAVTGVWYDGIPPGRQETR